MDNRSISHTRWKCQYHIVFIPKYRKKVLYGKVREDVREIINTLCKYKDVEIIAVTVPLRRGKNKPPLEVVVVNLVHRKGGWHSYVFSVNCFNNSLF